MKSHGRGNRLFSVIVLSFCLIGSFAIAEMREPYKQWIDEDVRWIASDQERSDYLRLSSDNQRDKFIEDFWARRDPTPGTPKNEFKEEHYRRIAYSNQHFAAGIPGWKTDRGRVYIVYGPPDRVESHTSDAMMSENKPYPYQVWTYRLIQGVGSDVKWEFVDTCACGEYHLTADPATKKPVR